MSTDIMPVYPFASLNDVCAVCRQQPRVDDCRVTFTDVPPWVSGQLLKGEGPTYDFLSKLRTEYLRSSHTLIVEMPSDAHNVAATTLDEILHDELKRLGLDKEVIGGAGLKRSQNGHMCPDGALSVYDNGRLRANLIIEVALSQSRVDLLRKAARWFAETSAKVVLLCCLRRRRVELTTWQRDQDGSPICASCAFGYLRQVDPLDIRVEGQLKVPIAGILGRDGPESMPQWLCLPADSLRKVGFAALVEMESERRW
ncbi:hypothetical protein KEM52_005330 [Ascosphaera acerosa]|nr:hypothetical protein KEM52_005330 [Ascosphaera acerosa]